MTVPALYGELAPWFHLLTSPTDEDYAQEARFLLDLLRDHARGPVTTVLELGSGGGNVASHLKHEVRLTLTDLSQAMLDVSASINPGVEHIAGDMRTLRLGRTFDAVLVHDAVSYLTTESDLAACFRTAFEHLRSGGAAVFAPDEVRDAFRPRTDHGGHDGADGRALRYLEWTTDPDPSDTTYVVDYALLLREADGTVSARQDRHVLGLFARAAWLAALRDAGFDPAVVDDPWGRSVFVGVRRG